VEADHDRYEKALGLAIIITFFVFFVELGGAIYSGSLSLLSDAGHMFRDLFALILSLGALRIARQLPSKEKTFGYHRVEIFAAFINGLLLVLLSGVIVREAYLRFLDPQPVKSPVMIAVAALGLAANLFIATRLRGSHDVNIRSAFLHVLADTLSSVAVVAAGIWIFVSGQTFVDPVVSAVLAGIIFLSAISVLRETVAILLQYAPKDVSFDDVIRAIESVEGVEEVHNVHLWSLCSHINVLDAHIYSCRRDPTEIERIKKEIKRRLVQYRILHSTLEFECELCHECGLIAGIGDDAHLHEQEERQTSG
jgi:cobalt-zinc-cadmium efflux system protein